MAQSNNTEFVEPGFDETVQSRFDDIKRDGPNIYTGMLENTDNSLEWGGATEIEIILTRESITIKDNGENGFGTVEALKRFFTLGKVNEGNVTEKTIGKYGKGGYKALISTGNRVEITTYFDGNEYTYGTNFIEMEEKNIMEPTSELKCEKNESGETGTKIKIFFRSEVGLTYQAEEARRHFIRAYHNYGRDIKISLKSGKEVLEFNPRDYTPYGRTQKEKTYYIYYQPDDGRFIFNTVKTEGFVMEIKSFVLRDRILNNPYLGQGHGNRKPGIDFYRCGRLCNTRYPIFNIGDVGTNLTMGQMRGMRCHIICMFADTKLTELISMDDCVGVTTVKDIYEDDRMNPSLIKILEEISKETSTMYETLITDQRNSFNTYISEIESDLKKLERMKDDILLENNYPLDEVFQKLDDYMNYQVYYFNTDTLKFRFCKSKDEAKDKSTNGEGRKCTKSNAIYKNIRDSIIISINSIQKRKNSIVEKEKEYQEIMTVHNIPREEAKTKYGELLRKKNADIAEEKRKKQLDTILKNAKSNHESKNYEDAIQLYNDYVETKDGECNEIISLIESIKEEQYIDLKEKIETAIGNESYEEAENYIIEIIDNDEKHTDEMDSIQKNINDLKIKREYAAAEEKSREEKYGASIKLYQKLLDEFELGEKEKNEIEQKILLNKTSAVQFYEKKVNELISSDSYKEAKKYSGYINKYDPQRANEIIQRIDANEKTYGQRIQSVTRKDVNNLYQNIMNDCQSDEDIQKIYKVLEDYRNNP